MKKPLAWIVTQGKMFKDRAFISERGAQESSYDRKDSAIVLPLYSLEPTHHAVIDEYGEIIYARRISGLLDAVEQCEYYIEQCRKDPVTRHSAKGWTVKEVTLHE